ncbi:hypothetical protein [Riemerella anatipestifer]|uniref:hypothetical protein n=1 Tax=Riemerella anatipestifer TaxID=34085 RepID=UPI0013723E80|nr:hypothetical protein [Riemerella anatipestifer]MBT0549941.1 hypothetical protein [Riemerella anatipestifer]MBT0556748.1 hypothetical protein [Riemerella anatipestifer]MBT0560701.1 hypothetical protein [Riemerella anatipestifer]MDY3525981.1 hypothetical protein [Riemerella anatipestifer]NAV17092.1 hypothetical protein [Riemerella anatipestifer]
MVEIMRFILKNWELVLLFSVVLLFSPFALNKFYPHNFILINLKQIVRIYFTNWINFVMVFANTLISSTIYAVLYANFSFYEAVFGSVYLVLGYGIMFWIGFFITIGILDILLFSFSKELKYIGYKLATEWLLISLPFFYWVVKYSQWIFFVAILAFLLGQYLRKHHLFKILK